MSRKNRKVKLEDENPTIGIILCKDKNNAVVEMTLPENNSQIFASKYETVLPSKEELQKLLEEQMDNKKFSEHSYRLESEYGRPSTRVQIDKIGLTMKQKFSLHYDFGDDWMFTITVQKIEETSEKIETKIIKEKGFVSQYLDWDEENLYEIE